MSNAVAFCVTDESARIVSCSLEFCELTGYPLREILGRNCNFLQGAATKEETVADIRADIQHRRTGEHVIGNYTKNGTFFWNYFRIVPVRASAAPAASRRRKFAEAEVAEKKGAGEDVDEEDEDDDDEGDEDTGASIAMPNEIGGLNVKKAEAFMERKRAQEREAREAEVARERELWAAEGGDPVVYFVGFQKSVGADPEVVPDIDALSQDDILPYQRLWIERLKPGVHAGLDVETGTLLSSEVFESGSAPVDKNLVDEYVTYAGRDVMVVGVQTPAPLQHADSSSQGGSDSDTSVTSADTYGGDDDGGTEAAIRAARDWEQEFLGQDQGEGTSATNGGSGRRKRSDREQARREKARRGKKMAAKLGVDPMQVEPRLVLGVSSCLLGERVRYDSGGMRDSFVVDTLGPYVARYVPVCPEVGIGLPVPRPTLRLVRDPEREDRPRLVCPANGNDYTDKMEEFAHAECDKLAKQHLSGFIFKANSPSSGIFGVKVYREMKIGSSGEKSGQGAFTRVFRQRFPLIPVEEEGRLNDLTLRENFLGRIFAFARLRTVAALKPTLEGLADFHAHMRLTIMLHSPVDLVALDRFLASKRVDWKVGVSDFTELLHAYAARLMAAMSRVISVDAHVRVMSVIKDTIAAELTPRDVTELTDAMRDFREGFTPWIVPITLLRHHVNRNRAPKWLRIQFYLTPSPREMMLGTRALGPTRRTEQLRARAKEDSVSDSTTKSACDSCTSGACGAHVGDMSW